MSRSQRLLDLIQILRRHRYPVSGAQLAGELGISLRTLYRDIATLQAQGATIQGEPGLGYILRPGFLLPPLMFTEEELEALMLGMRWVSERADHHLAQSARSALARIAAVLPADLRESLSATSLFIGPGEVLAAGDTELAAIRLAIRREHKLRIRYRDGEGAESSRVIWPVALAFFDRVRILAAWCEMREDFRHFRTDRITALEACGERYPGRRAALLKQWREATGIRPRSLELG